jgi:4-amino-4-deoxy-L-arabinose transferase-like glycosyltransferase
MIKNKYFKISLLFSLLFLYFFSRLQNLTSIPVFGDEAIYIRWAQIIQSEETLRFIPQTDGKQPLFMWINAVTLKLIADPLVAARFVSVMAGFAILIFLFLTTAIFLNYSSKEKNIFNFVKTSVINNFYPSLFSSLIYVFIPFSFFFDRLALADTLLSFFGLFSLFFSLLLAKYPRLDLSLILGFVLGLAWLTKSPAIYFIVLSFFTFLLFNLSTLKYLIFPTVSAILAFLIYNILRLGPQFSQIALRNQDYLWTLSEILIHPLDPLKPHLFDTYYLYQNYLSLPLLIFTLIGLFFYLKKNKLAFKYLILASWWILPLISNAAMAKVFTARYILFTLPPLLILLSIFISYFLSLIKSHYFKAILIVAIFIPNLYFIFQLSTRPFYQNLYSTETGYLKDWTSGWGIKEAADYLKERSKVSNVIVGTEGAFGTLPDGLQIYTNKVPQLTVIGQGLDFTQIPLPLIDAKNHGDEVYLLINKSRNKINSAQLNQMKVIKSFDKPDGDQLLLYQL